MGNCTGRVPLRELSPGAYARLPPVSSMAGSSSFQDEDRVRHLAELFDDFLEYIRNKYQERARGLHRDDPSPFYPFGFSQALAGRHPPSEDPVFLALLQYLIETTYWRGLGCPLSRSLVRLFLRSFRGDLAGVEAYVVYSDIEDPYVAQKIRGFGRKTMFLGQLFRAAGIKWKGVLTEIPEDDDSIRPASSSDDGDDGNDGDDGGSPLLGSTIGIDLGTSYSCASIYKNGLLVSLLNDKGKHMTPSWVAYTDERLIGEDAEQQATVKAERTIFNVKRLIGRRFEDPDVQDDMELVPYKIANKDGVPYIKVNMDSSELSDIFSPEDVIALIIAKIKENAEHAADTTVKDAVVTVPAYLNDAQRQAIKNACAKACLNVAGIINESTAAAIAYGRYKKDGQKNILVFRLGGGTFDVSIFTIDNGAFVGLATNGDKLGGEDFDKKIMRYFINLINEKHGKDISRDNQALGKLRRECESAKRVLSNQQEVQVEIESLWEGFDFSERLTQNLFEELNDAFFIRTMWLVNKTMNDAGLNKYQIDEVVLTGGSSRIPKIRQLLQDYFAGQQPKIEVVVDEAAAQGAALLGGILSGNVSIFDGDILILDTAPSFTRTGAMTTLIHRSIMIPPMKPLVFTANQDRQTTDYTQIFEEESIVSKWILSNKFAAVWACCGVLASATLVALAVMALKFTR